MSSVLGEASLAGRLCVSTLPGKVGLDNPAQSSGLLGMPASSIADGRDDFSGHAQTAGPVVSGDLVGNGAEERSQCPGAATHSGTGELLHCLDLAAQASSGHGATRP